MFGDFGDLLRRLSMDVTGFANALRDVLANPAVSSKTVRVTILAGQTTAEVKHGLPRAPLGAAVIGASAAGAYVVDPVTTADRLRVRAGAAVGADTTLTLLVL
ncbi:MAG TPA: hypothetical protein VFZ61_03665 [Polyangiales bacterium]